MSNQPILHGETISLHPMSTAYSQALFDSLKDQEVNRLTGSHGTFTLEQIEAFHSKIAEADDRIDYAMVLKGDPALVLGEAVINEYDEDNHSASFRIALYSSNFFGKGYGTQATRLIVRQAFEQFNLHRLDLEVFDFNPRAAHVYEKVGFVREGVRRDALFWDGNYHSAILMSILRPEFEKLYL